MLNFNALPTDKPSQNNVADGTFKATIFSAKMVVSKTTGNEYLNVSFKLKDGGFVNENYFDSDKSFPQYAIGRLLRACNVDLNGTGTLKDIAKVIVNKEVIIDVVVNDKGYGSLDYSGNKEGIYKVDEVEITDTDNTEPTELSADVADAVYDTSDDDF